MSQHNYPWLGQGRQQPNKETRNMTAKETKQPEFIELKPNWQSFFELAKKMTAEKIPEGEGRGFIIEVLNYGQELDAAVKQHNDEVNKEGE